MADIFTNTQIHANPLIQVKKAKICFLLIIFFLLSGVSRPLWAQYKAPTKAQKEYNEILRDVNKGDYESATKSLRKLVKKYPDYDKALLTLSDLLLFQKKIEEAFIYYVLLTERAPTFSHKPWFALGKRALESADYKKGSFYFDQLLLLTSPPKNIGLDAELYLAQCNFAIQAQLRPVDYNPFNMGDSINSEVDEYLPSLTADDETLIFTRRTAQSEDFYISYRIDSTWTMAEAMPKPLNSVQNEGAHCLTADGNTMFFTACYRNDTYGGCDLYSSRKTVFGWDRPINLGSVINTEHWESQPSISYDSKTLYFISNRPSGYGGSDIWSSKLQADSSWGVPENLGPVVNSRKDDISPYIHPDDQTLYFASEGLPGMGKLDIYFTKRGADGNWETPVNLGYPINTEKDESSLFVNLSGRIAMFSSQARKSKGANDIYYFELPENLRPEKVIYVKGEVRDKHDKRPLNSLVDVVDLNTGNVVHSAETFVTDGKFMISLPAGKSFAFNVSRQGYLLYSENFIVDTTQSASTVYNIALEKIQLGSEVVLKNIFYQSNAFTLEERSTAELEKLARFLRKNPNMVVEIQGHTDNIGSKSYNKELSHSRAKTVYEALIRSGVQVRQLVFQGYGDTQAMADNSTEAGRAINRRTQFKVLKL